MEVPSSKAESGENSLQLFVLQCRGARGGPTSCWTSYPLLSPPRALHSKDLSLGTWISNIDKIFVCKDGTLTDLVYLLTVELEAESFGMSLADFVGNGPPRISMAT